MRDPASPHKIALVTGANRGIGLEVARQLAAQDITVFVCARHLQDAQSACSAIGAETIPLQLDVTKQADIDAAVQTLTLRFGRLDILVNNAGVFLEMDGLSPDILRQTFEANTIGPFAMIHAFRSLLEQSPAGRIVNQSSDRGSFVLGPSMEGDAVGYSASKAALNMLTATLVRQFADTNIKINAAHPGWVQTDMGSGDLTPQQGAETAVRLALLPDDGPTGKFFHGMKEIPW